MRAHAERLVQAFWDGLLRLFQMVATGVQYESRRRRMAWAGVAVAICVGAFAFNVSRQSQFEASLEIFPRPVPPYPAVTDVSYYRTFLRDPELRRQMLIHVGPEVAKYDSVTIVPSFPGGPLTVTAGAATPARARAFVNALGPQLASASARQLRMQGRRDIARIQAELGSRGVPRGRRVQLRQRVLAIARLGPDPPHRAVVGPRAGVPPRHRVADRIAVAVPGGVPARSSALGPVAAGLAVVAMLWAVALLLAPPVAALGPMRAQLRGRAPVPRWLRAAHDWFTRPVPRRALRGHVDSAMPSWAAAAAALALACAALVIVWMGRGEIFLADEWGVIVGRRGASLDAYIQPFNEHLILLPIAVFKALFATVGIGSYLPYRLSVVFAHVAGVALVFTFARRRVGSVVAAAMTAPFLVFGPGFDVLLFPINLDHQASVIAGIGMLVALDRGDRRGDVAAGVLLALSLASSSLGVCFALGGAVEFLARGDWRRRAWVVAVPVALYGGWYLAYNLHPHRQGPLLFAEAPGFAWRAAVGSLSALLGVPLGVETEGYGYGVHRALELLAYVGALVGATLLVRYVVRHRTMSARLAMLATTAVSFWLITGVARAYSGQWYASRYAYPGAILILLVVAEALRGVTLARRALAVAVAVAVGAAALNVGWLYKDSNGRRADTQALAAELGGLELVRDYVRPELAIDDKRALFLSAGGYFQATDELGSPALTSEQLARAPGEARSAADTLLRRAVFRVTPYQRNTRRPPLRARVSGSAAPFAVRARRCIAIGPPPGKTVRATLALPERGLVVAAAPPGRVAVGVRRFGSMAVRSGTYVAGRGQLVAAPPDRSPRPWLVTFSSAAPFRIC